MRLFLSSLFLFISLGIQAQSVVIEDLKKAWQIYDAEDKTLYPYTNQPLSTLQSLLIPISLERYKGQQVVLSLNASTSLFINNQVVFYTPSDRVLKLNVDSLVGKGYEGTVHVQLFNKEGLSKTIQSRVLSSDKDTNLKVGALEDLPKVRLDDQSFYYFFYLAGLLVLIGLALLRVFYGRTFQELFSVRTIFSTRSRDEAYSRLKPINPINLLFFAILSLALGMLLIGLVQFGDQTPGIIAFLAEMNAYTIWLSWLTSSLIIFMVIAAKFLLIYYCSILFGLRANQTGHFIDYMQLSLVFFMGLFVLVYSMLHWISGSSILLNLILIATFLFSLFRVLLLFFKLLRQTGFQNLHLIAYLCATELIPLVVGFKIFS
ncbi:DUF4271 domain-containing protein [Cytophagales bacterium LB-30]|uniref:DUF4271 domain-containing protein n=1 Tax=Shiella aurantiaca TaxID=3058365 RepID=A0ABT8F6P1_9BACT|nr:DUF4271 domain-containing protein [Shiella aurantiaca]MDN4166153.1 DUF4271 domain-containing protein [Shiella aurantiaca]